MQKGQLAAARTGHRYVRAVNLRDGREKYHIVSQDGVTWHRAEACPCGCRPENLPTQGELLPIEHVTYHMSRLDRAAERVYWRRWAKAADALLPALLGGTPVTQRDAVVAAAIVQWLGTACGRGFIWGAEHELMAVEAYEEQLDRGAWLARYDEQRRRRHALVGARVRAAELAGILGHTSDIAISKIEAALTLEHGEAVCTVIEQRERDLDAYREEVEHLKKALRHDRARIAELHEEIAAVGGPVRVTTDAAASRAMVIRR